MAVSSLVVCDFTRYRLGDDGPADLAACLWAVDCQTCGRLLGDAPPAVFVHDLTVTAVASLHHQQCRQPGWTYPMVTAQEPGKNTTFVARMMLLPPTWGDGRAVEPCPLMLVNPGNYGTRSYPS